jgi:hypothetical protein
MSYFVFNKAHNNFFNFSIERGDVSHARTMIDKLSMSEAQKQKIRSLIAVIPFPANGRSELNQLLGAAPDVGQRIPAKKGVSDTKPLSPDKGDHWGDHWLNVRWIGSGVLSFLNCKELASAMEVHSAWQANALEAGYLQLRDQRQLDFSNLLTKVFYEFASLLHLDHPQRCFQYFKSIHCLIGSSANFEDLCFHWDAMNHWKHSASVQQLQMFIPLNQVPLYFSRFPSLETVFLLVEPRQIHLWSSSVFACCATTLNTLCLKSATPDLPMEVVEGALKAVAGLSALRILSIELHKMCYDSGEHLSLVAPIFASNPYLHSFRCMDMAYDTGFNDNDCFTMFEGMKTSLRSLEISVKALVANRDYDGMFSVRGMRALALAFPRLENLALYIRGERSGEQPLPIPFQGAAALAKSWPWLKHLVVSGVWTYENLDTIMAGHRTLNYLQIEDVGGADIYRTDWNDEYSLALDCIAGYGGQHLQHLNIAGRPLSLDALPDFFAKCTHLKSFIFLKKDIDCNSVAESKLLSLRSKFPQIQISMQS